jgi:addiction module HigA family antidote
MTPRPTNPPHPGGTLADAIRDRGTTIEAVSAGADIRLNYLRTIVDEQANIDAETALRLGRYFGTSPEFWANLQSAYDLDIAAEELGAKLEAVVPLPGVEAVPEPLRLDALILAARGVSVDAGARLDLIHKNSAWPIRYDPGTGASVTEAPPETRAVIDHLQRIRRTFARGCAALASDDPTAEAAAHHFREVLRLAGIGGGR